MTVHHRRRFLQKTLALMAFAAPAAHRAAASPGPDVLPAVEPDRFCMPDEGARHACTWMAFGPSASIWGRELLPRARRDLALLARTIARYEPVRLLVRPNELALARSLVGDVADIEFIPCPLDDLWIRDTGPTFVRDSAGTKAAIDFNFNGWGRKQAHARDAGVAAFVARHAGVPCRKAPLVMEGGCIEVDGAGTAIVTESCTLNRNRNPGMSRAEFEDRLMPLLGLEKIVWLPGIRGRDITDGHTDFYARFARPGVVIAGLEEDRDLDDHAITREHLEILLTATDAAGRQLEVHPLSSPATVRAGGDNEEFAAGYIGFYVCNGAVIVQQFGDREADARARETLARAFPGRTIEPLDMDGIAAGGGSVHCATQQEPA